MKFHVPVERSLASESGVIAVQTEVLQRRGVVHGNQVVASDRVRLQEDASRRSTLNVVGSERAGRVVVVDDLRLDVEHEQASDPGALRLVGTCLIDLVLSWPEPYSAFRQPVTLAEDN